MRVDEDPRHHPHTERTDETTDDEAALADVDHGEFPPDGHSRPDEVSTGKPAVGVAEVPPPAETLPPGEAGNAQAEPSGTVYRDAAATGDEHADTARDEGDRLDETDLMGAAATGPDHPGEAERAEAERADEADRADEAQRTDEAERTEAQRTDEPEELAPGEVPVVTTIVLWEAEVVDGFRDRWQQIQLRFIDDPRHAAQQAQTLTGDVCDGLTSALGRHRSELDRWQSAQLDDTEELRMTVRRYRDLLDRLLGL
jgi:hypothetical protein